MNFSFALFSHCNSHCNSWCREGLVCKEKKYFFHGIFLFSIQNNLAWFFEFFDFWPGLLQQLPLHYQNVILNCLGLGITTQYKQGKRNESITKVHKSWPLNPLSLYFGVILCLATTAQRPEGRRVLLLLQLL